MSFSLSQSDSRSSMEAWWKSSTSLCGTIVVNNGLDEELKDGVLTPTLALYVI